MHKVILKGKEAVSVKCTSCKTAHEVQANRHTHPVTMAFTHPKQAIAAKCRSCEKDFSWSPEELVTKAIQMEQGLRPAFVPVAAAAAALA